jgi:hypothetical protein
MANSAGLCYSFKTELLDGIHAFGTSVVRAATTADTFYGALFLASGSLSPSTTTAYSVTSEVPNSGTYAAGGQAVTNATAPTQTAGTAYWTPSGNLSWTGFTGTAFDTVLIYNNTAASKNAVGVFTFSTQTITAGTFTLTMPTNNNTTGLVRLA